MQVGDIVLLCGYCGHGKDTFYTWLSRQAPEGTLSPYQISPPLPEGARDLPCQRLSFAHSLKQEVAQLLGVTPEFIDANKAMTLSPEHLQEWCSWSGWTVSYEADDLSTIDITYRDILIQVATYHRDHDPDHFAKAAMQSYRPDMLNVITDFRFKNEYLYCSDLARTHVIRVGNRNAPVPAADIASEHDLDGFHVDHLVEHG